MGPFSLGRVFITRHAADSLDDISTFVGLRRHAQCDWGELCTEDRQANDEALRSGGRLFSAYKDSQGVKFWIITEADRSSTTILLPEDY